MNVILQQPASVLVVTRTEETVSQVRTAVAGSPETSVRHVAGPDSALDLLDDTDDVGCVVLDESVPDVTSLRAAVAERDDRLPVAFLATDADRNLLSRLSRFDSTTYLPRPVAAGTLREVVEESLDRYHRKRVTAEESDMLRAFVSEMEIPVFVKDEAGRHLRMTDVPGSVDQNAVVGKTDREVYGYDPEAAAEFYADDMRVVEEGVAIRQQDEASGPAGNEHWTRVSKVPWPAEDGSTKGLLGIAMDVTDLKEAERRAEQLRDRLEQFASYISHDLQNPLNLASGHLQMAREDGDEAALDTVAAALDRIDEMVTDLDHLARRPPQGGIREYVEIAFTARQVWSFVETGGAELSIETPETARIRASEEELRPLFENLLRNAVVHGGPDVTVRIGTLDDGFYVADDGTGIPPAEREKVLQRGYTTCEEGSGTGLSIVSEIADHNDWSVQIAESADGGARFEFRDALVVPEPVGQRETGPSLELAEESAVSDVTGSADFESRTDTWTVAGDAGVDAGARAFYAAHAVTDGPVRIQGRLRTVEHVHDRSSAGLWVGDGLSGADAFGYVGRTVGGGTELVYRPEPGGETDRTLLDDAALEWFRLDRVGGTLTCSASVDGTDWDAIDQRSLSLADPVRPGLAVYSAVPGDPCEATFSTVRAYERR